ncbi:FAD-dependent 2-octaprenylphenol hydroxylase [Vibrio rumoiensis]|uniref:FAD-dependent 2-octaprenylphenol hydroxylase n=1 Tax=Vibrio rumoiensis 1S-45 TaxID=1188252 RepID=A0A1E5E4L5_9VIBR|nr:FAD-dependent 2-octaprenylphenol hydroxylase [Vibrio rumoiensis]OEF27772.1 FAD-dependent 2-octaprenylphenol hydroxylase [Vibrio rumoiensis 1S-45]
MQSFDITVVGGGMVGLALAASFAETNLRIAVIESVIPDDTLLAMPDTRVSALSRASELFLKNIKAWDGIISRRLSPYQAMEVWEKDSFARLSFNADDLSQSNLGHIVENRVIQLALLDRVKQLANVTLFMPSRCMNMAVGESETWITLESGDSISTKLVVGADGANSWVRKQQDIPLTHWDYGHSAIVANIRTSEPHEGVARQIFTPQGPIAFLPLSDPHLCSLVWSTDPNRADTLISRSNTSFNQYLTSEFDGRLGLCEVEGERHSFPLKMRYARNFVVNRVALVGDAAHTIHPLAGQGVNLGFLDAASLAEVIMALWEQGEDIGLQRNLRSYERWRKAEAAKMIAAMQGFKDLFEGDNPAKKLVRGLGMQFIGHLPGMKEEMMKRALGITGKLPSLVK